MRYQERVLVIGSALANFLRQFSTPGHLSDEQLRRDRVMMTAEALNANIPTGLDESAIQERLDRCFRKLVLTHRSSSWPSVAQFAEAMKEVGEAFIPVPQSSDVFDADGKIVPERVWANSVRKGERLCASYLHGEKAQKLRDLGITEEQLDRYRKGWEYDKREIWGSGSVAQ